jgi:hypothetical protein
MEWLLERLAADEAAVRRELSELHSQVAVLEERLTELAAARKVVTPLLAEHPATAGTGPAADPGAPDALSRAVTSRSGFPSGRRRELTGVDEQVVVVVASAERPMRAKDVAQALGEPDVRGRVETTRARLKKLVAAGWLTQAEPGLFAIATGINGNKPEGAARNTM